MNTNIVHRLLARPGDAPAYVDAEGAVSYAELTARVRAYAARLSDIGFRPGSRALIVADDAVPTVVAILAVWWTGGIPVPVSPMLTVPEIEFVARDCYAAFLHTDRPAAARLPRTGAFDLPRGDETWLEPFGGVPAVSNQDDGDVVLVQYTSGSTGKPKGVLHTRAGVDAVLAGFGRLLHLHPGDTVLSTAKLSFGYGFGNSVLFPLAAGARAILAGGAPDPYSLSAAIAAHRPTVLFSVPRMYAALLDRDPAALGGSLRLAVSAGEHLPAPICAEFARRFRVPLVNGLGATEVLHIVVATRGTQPGSTGSAVPGVRITVRDDDGDVLPDGADGRLHVAGPSVGAGYLDRPEATARTFADGGAYTGDIVRRGPGGVIDYVCRRDDLINVGGFKVSPLEIEAAVRDVAGVAQCAVVGSRDDRGLEQAVAYLVPAPGAEPDVVCGAARRAFRTRLPALKRPAEIQLVESLPVTSTGKLARYQLR
ncbi:AMP-binding protein [Actinomycetes bacterium KLBMP 9797]